ncbi:39384_t:CDS:2 [Gigaspora margarita]|uniref:39384_t:CDS:1 n=1 Tax=Gigaspora margarita TaxID=4874 RepID=A0ABM8VX90_GIGMA|nr:39384_t:CDS:2 [Gigaspora margarita]
MITNYYICSLYRGRLEYAFELNIETVDAFNLLTITLDDLESEFLMQTFRPVLNLHNADLN